MKHLLSGVAAAAALVVAVPVWAQSAPPAAPPAAAAAPVQSMNRMPAGGRATSERGARGAAARGHHRSHAAHPSAVSAADQLNRQELSQLQGGNPTTMNRMPAGGRATSGGNQ